MSWFFMIFQGIFMIFYGSWLAFIVFHFSNYRPSDAMFAMYRWSLASGDQLAGRRPWSASWQQHTRWSNWRQLVLIDIWSSLTDNPSEVQTFFEMIGPETFLLLSLQGFILWGLETNKCHYFLGFKPSWPAVYGLRCRGRIWMACAEFAVLLSRLSCLTMQWANQIWRKKHLNPSTTGQDGYLCHQN